jgi:hypothetical protein
LEVAVDLGCGTETNSFEIENGAGSLNQFTRFSRACRLHVSHHPKNQQKSTGKRGGSTKRGSANFSYSLTRFCKSRSCVVILYMALISTFPSCSMYTGRPSCNVSFKSTKCKTREEGYLVVFMVVSGVVDCYEGIFSEDEGLANFIDAEILAPLFAVCEHDKGLLNIVFSCTQETTLLTRQQMTNNEGRCTREGVSRRSV